MTISSDSLYWFAELKEMNLPVWTSYAVAAVPVGESNDFSWADEGEVQRIKEEDHILSLRNTRPVKIIKV